VALVYSIYNEILNYGWESVPAGGHISRVVLARSSLLGGGTGTGRGLNDRHSGDEERRVVVVASVVKFYDRSLLDGLLGYSDAPSCGGSRPNNARNALRRAAICNYLSFGKRRRVACNGGRPPVAIAKNDRASLMNSIKICVQCRRDMSRIRRALPRRWTN